MARALPAIGADGHDVAARSDALFGAWACGTCLGAVGMALHHKLCHTLGGSFDLPHAETHAVMLPHACAFNAPAAPAAMARIAAALGSVDAASGLQALARGLGVPRSLQALGLPYAALDRAAREAVREPYWNPRPFGEADLRGLLERAWHGSPPEAS